MMNIDLTSAFVKGADYELAVRIITKLESAGFIAYFAGGCVRDALIGKNFKDIDIVTSALPDQIEDIFNGQTIPVAKKFGIIIVHNGPVQIEVATFRKDGEYQDGRRPEGVVFSNEIEDAQRRDFTVNALFYDLKKKQVLDYVGGVQDIKNKTLRTVGDAGKRFSEDYLRIHRLYRFSLSLDFRIETETLKSAQNHMSGIMNVSAERKHEELLKVFFSGVSIEKIYQFYLKQNLFVLFFDRELEEVSLKLFQSLIKDEVDLLGVILWNENQNALSLLNKLKLSSKTQKSVKRILSYKENWQEIQKKSEPEKRFLCIDQDFLRFLEKQKTLESSLEVDRLLVIGKDYQVLPPQPLLSGEDLIAYFQGKELGHALDLVFKEQLVQNWTQKESALTWILKQKV